MAAPVNVRNAKAPDPYLNFKFLVSWATPSGKVEPVAYVNKISALAVATQVVTWREGGAPQGVRRIPGQTEYGPITLERGVSIDIAFEQWANKVWYYQNSGKLGLEVSLADFRKDILIEMMNQAGQVVLKYNVFSCWPSNYVALPQLDSGSNEVAIQSLTLQTEGWARDDSYTPAKEPTVSEPTKTLTQTFTPPTAG